MLIKQYNKIHITPLFKTVVNKEDLALENSI